MKLNICVLCAMDNIYLFEIFSRTVAWSAYFNQLCKLENYIYKSVVDVILLKYNFYNLFVAVQIHFIYLVVVATDGNIIVVAERLLVSPRLLCIYYNMYSPYCYCIMHSLCNAL